MKIVVSNNKENYPETNRISGSYIFRNREYVFYAKIYSEPSIYGINDGHVSKLWVEEVDTNRIVVEYDRGHNKGNPNCYNRGMIKKLIDFLDVYAVEAMRALWEK